MTGWGVRERWSRGLDMTEAVVSSANAYPERICD